MADSLRQIPTSALKGSDGTTIDSFSIVSGDLDRASTLAHVDRPKADAAVDDIVTWASAITGQRSGQKATGVTVFPADAFDLVQVVQVVQIGDELGWSVLDVSTYVELQAAPQFFTVMTGTFDPSKIDAAQGERSHDIWSLGGDDFSQDLAATSPARPLGESLRTGLREKRLGQARSAQPIADWLIGSNALDRDDGLQAVSKALDSAKVYSATVVRSDFGGDPRLPPSSGAPQGLQPFDTLGVGSAMDDAGAVLVLAYHSADTADAKANVDLLRTLFTDGTSAQTGQKWSALVRLDDVTSNGGVVVVTLHPLDGRSAMIGIQGVATREAFATHV